MAFKKKNIYDVFGTALVLSALLSTASAVDCLGKSFHCVNASHFMICVDVGGGVSQSIDDFTIPCPPPTVCQGNNHFECEFPITTTPSTTLSNVISQSTKPWEEVDITTVSPSPNNTKEYSEKYMNTESLTSLSVNSYTTDAVVDYSTEAVPLIDTESITETSTAVTETLLYDTTTSSNLLAEQSVTSAGKLFTETDESNTLVQQITNDAGLVSTSTKKTIPFKLNTTEPGSLIDTSITESSPAVTESLQYDTTTNQGVITQTITEHNEVSAEKILSETANNYTLGQEVTTKVGLESTSTEKVISSKLNTTDAALLINNISITGSGAAVTEALPYDSTTNQDVITQTITEHNEETANNYTLGQEVTTDEGLVSTTTEKAVPLKLNTTEAASLTDSISITESGLAVTEALTYDGTTNQDVVTQTIAKHNEVATGELSTETAINYTLGQEVTTVEGLVSTSTEKEVSSKLNNMEAASLIDDINITETGITVEEALPYDTMTSQAVVTPTKTDHNVGSAGKLLTETANNYTLVQEVTTNEGLVSTSTKKTITSTSNTNEPGLSKTEALPYDPTTSKDVITEAITDHNVAVAGGLSTESANTLVQQITTDKGLLPPSTETTILGMFYDSSITDNSVKLTTKPVKVDIGKTIINEIRERANNQVKTTSESITIEISVVNKLPSTTDSVFATDANLIDTDQRATITNMLDYRPTTESELATAVDGTITTDVNLFTTEQPVVADVSQTILIPNSLNYATTTSESTTVENVVLNNLTLFGKDAVPDTIADFGIEISLVQEQNSTNNKPLSTENISSEARPTEQIIVDVFNNSISTDMSSISTTETVYLITNDTWSKTKEVLDQIKLTSNSMVTEVSVSTELPRTVYATISDGSTDSPEDVVRNAENKTNLNYATTSATTTIKDKVRTERPIITSFEENTVSGVTNMVTESPLFLKKNLTGNAPVNQISIDNTGLGSYSNNPVNFARGSEIVTTDETKHNVLDQATLGPDSIVAVTNISTDLPTSIDDNITTVTNVTNKYEVTSTENTLLNTNIIKTDTLLLENKNTIINATVNKATPIHEYSVTTDHGINQLNNGYLQEAPPQVFPKNKNDDILNPTITEQAPSTNNIDIDVNLATAVNNNPPIAKKNPIASIKNPGNSPKHLEFVEYNATEYLKTIITDENLLPVTVYIQTEKLTTPSSDTENKINSGLSDNFGTPTEKSFVQHNVSTEQLIIKEIQDSITTDTSLETRQAIPEVKNNQKPIPGKDAGSVLASTQQIFNKTSDLDVETGTLLKDTFDNTSHNIPSFIDQINKVEAADNYDLDMAADSITEEPYYVGDTTSAPFIVTTVLAAGEKNNNKIEDQISNSELILDVNKNIAHAETFRPTDLYYNDLNPISNIIFNTNVKQSDVNKLETTTGANIALASGLSQEKNLTPIENQAKEYVGKVVDSFLMKQKTTDLRKKSEASFYATITTEKPNFVALPMNTKFDDSAKTTTLDSHGIKPDLVNHKDLFIAEQTKQLPINDKNGATLNYDKYNFLTDTSTDDLKNKTDLNSHTSSAAIAAINKDHSSTFNATNANENKNDLQGIIINTTDNMIIKAQKGSDNYLTTTTFKTDELESEKINNYNILESGSNVQDPKYHNPPTETYTGLDVDSYPELTILDQSFSHVYKPTQITSKNNYFTTAASSLHNDAKIITEKPTSITGVDLNEASVVNGNIYLPQLDKTLQRPAVSSVVTDKQKIYNTGDQDGDGFTTKDSAKFAPADVNVGSKPIGTQVDLPEKNIGRTEDTETVNPYVAQLETTPVHIQDANQNKKDEVPSVLQTKNSTPKFPQFEDAQDVHPLIGNIFSATSETSSQRPITDDNYNVAQSGSSVQAAHTTQEYTNTKAKASTAWDGISNKDNNIQGKTSESFLPRQDVTNNLPTKIPTDSSEPYPATSTSRTINDPNPVNEAKGINNILVTDEPMILVLKNKSVDNLLTQTQPHLDKEIMADVYQINTSSSVIANAEHPHFSSITPSKSLTVSRNFSQPTVIDVNASSLIQDTKNNTNNMQGNLELQDKTIEKQAAVVTQNQLLYKTSITQANQTHNNSITVQNDKNNITSNVYRDGYSSLAKESINISRKIGTIAKTLLSQNHTNATKEVAKTQQNAKSHKVVNTVNNSTQASVKRVPLRPVSSVIENPTKQVLSYPPLKYNCINGTRGRYSDKNDCRKFYICVGNNQPIVGICPSNTVFSDIKKLCTRNMSHCIRENQFKCPSAGRFSDLVNDVYYICVNHNNNLYRFKFQCQKGFSLNKTITRCMEHKEIVPNDSVTIFSSDRSQSSTAGSTSKSSSTSSISSSSRGDTDSSNSSQSKKSGEKNETEIAEETEKPDNKEEDESDEVFVCRKEGKFPIRNECRRYYLCKKNRKSEYRRKIKKCGSGDVFNKSKKKCVDAESYEC